jgi:hypothetical protein
MASNDINNPVDVNNPSNTRRSSDLLPGYLRTDKNTKFLASTLDQLIQQPQLERINGFMGDKLTPTYNPETDNYIDSGTALRNAYQLQPSLVVKDQNNQFSLSSGFDDLINQLNFYGANTNNLDRLFRPRSYSYDPMIDWDKFVNFREYYWLPTGTDSVEITGQQKQTQSTYTVTDSADGQGLVFTPDGLTSNPLLTLYRGLTYVFNVNSKYPFYIKTAYTKTVNDLYSNATGNGTANGQVILTIDNTTPDILFYFAQGNANAVGQINVKALAEDIVIDIEKDIIGKQSYISGNGVTFSNGMKIHFAGAITPSTYQDKEFIIEGVGTAIKLVDFDSLSNAGLVINTLDTNFDATPFDQYPFDDFANVPLVPEYVTINRASKDKNPWSRYNRWVHADVIAAVAEVNGVPPVYDTAMRAQRPIIEFQPDIQLFNFGANSKPNVDLIDTVTKDAIAAFEGSPGFYIDGVLVEQGFRVVFNADTDPLVKGKVFEVKYVTAGNNVIVNLEEAEDAEPSLNDSLVVTRGTSYQGTNWWYDGVVWQFGQQKTSLNQAPLYELFDNSGNRYSDQTIYNSSFVGTAIFGYTRGTGTADPVLGFPLTYKNVSNVGDYLFSNFFTTDTFTTYDLGVLSTLSVADGFLKVNNDNGEEYRNVWIKSNDKAIPILQFQVVEQATPYIEINAIDDAGFASDLAVDVFVNNVKIINNVDYTIGQNLNKAFIVPTNEFASGDAVLFKIYTAQPANSNGYYEPPINLTNNPLNGPIGSFTFTELSDHVSTIVENNDLFVGSFPGNSNLRDLSNLSAYGSRLVQHIDPLVFAHYFLGNQKNNIVDAIRKVAFDYNQFKTSLIKQVTGLTEVYTPAQALDIALTNLNSGKDLTFPYTYTDMLGHGNNYVERVYTVTNKRVKNFSLISSFDQTVLSERAILVYLTSASDLTKTPVLLTNGYDYTIDPNIATIYVNATISVGDVITIRDYTSTVGSYVPPTPTKLGLYPAFKPSIFVDDTYITPTKVIQGHDGSITVAYGDYRDAILLEYETRIYNNLKVKFNPDLLTPYETLPGAFRPNDYSLADIDGILVADFLKWVGFFSVDYQTNLSYDELNPFTYNYTGSVDSVTGQALSGSWRSIYKYYYDTDRPHVAPWEMLGFTEMPSWWTSMYGAAPYTSGNGILWGDLEAGRINGVINPLFARPGLSKIIPVDDMGALLDPTTIGLATSPVPDLTDPNRIVVLRSTEISANWVFGDQGPAETAWRRSSYWPFVQQVLLALTRPSSYAATMFDTSRMVINLAGQISYQISTNDIETINPATVAEFLYRNNTGIEGRILASGYSVFVIETNLVKNQNYLTQLSSDLTNLNYNLMVKLGGFASKDKLTVSIDAVDPTSPYPGVLIPAEDYSIFFNQSATTQSLSISGIIVQKTPSGFIFRGYDKYSPYFTILQPYATNVDQYETVGGTTEAYLTWSQNTTYQAGQIVFYTDRYYRVTITHNSDTAFNATYYQVLPYLPTVGGISVIKKTSFGTTPVVIPYGTKFTTLQDAYDVIIGYGQWLISQGFVFDEYNADLGQILDWNFSGREFLFWTTQNWNANSVITLSPFANKLVLSSSTGVVDNLLNEFYEYSLLKADGSPFPVNSFTVVRLDGITTVSTVNTTDGLFYARLNLVQKEHVIVFNNLTLFNDVVYDIESGYRQHRINLKGFRTSNWNGDFFSPGFIFDQAIINDWQQYTDYSIGDVVRFAGKYYSAPTRITGSASFVLNQWVQLDTKPTPNLLPNFDYKIGQFEDFYSLDIDNFDAGQQAAAQHLVGYTPRPYLNYIIGDPIAQYKFYQGYIREKGTKSPLTKLSKSLLNKFKNNIDFKEEWAFRIGEYGGYNTYQELETTLSNSLFYENPQIVSFVSSVPVDNTGTIYYKTESDLVVKPLDYDVAQTFITSDISQADSQIKIPVAGYVRFDDITVTAFNYNSVLDIANNKGLLEGDTIWLGNTPAGSWDVLRVTQIPTYIVNVAFDIPGVSLIFSTYYTHQLSVGDIISVSRVASGIDRIYVVSQILSPTDFVVNSTLSTLPALTVPLSGLLFAFKSSRLATLDNLADVPFLDRWKDGEKVWVDTISGDATSPQWAVFEKTNNYSSVAYSTGIKSVAQHFGSTIYSNSNIDKIVVSAPDFYDTVTGNYGRVYILSKNPGSTPLPLFNYSLNDATGSYYTGTTNSFGSSLYFDAKLQLSIASAPTASGVKTYTTGTIAFAVPTVTASGYVEQGIVKLSLINYNLLEEVGQVAITTPHHGDNANFGASLVAAPNSTSTTLMVGAPGEYTAAGSVYVYNVGATTSTIYVTPNASITLQHTLAHQPPVGSLFGYSMSGNADLSRVAVSAPGYPVFDTLGNTVRVGAVYVYNFASTSTEAQLILGNDTTIFPAAFTETDSFGDTVKMSQDGNYLFIGSPSATDQVRGTKSGIVDVLVWSTDTNKYVFSQRIHAPISSNDISFGHDISIDELNRLVVIASLGNSKTTNTSFDVYSERLANSFVKYGSIYINDSTSDERKRKTTFDSGSTKFFSQIKNAGAAHAYNKADVATKWSFSQELFDQSVISDSLYGQSVLATQNSVFVGSPGNIVYNANNNGQIFEFDKIDETVNGWAQSRTQDALVNLSAIDSAVTIDSTTAQIKDYIDVIDPVKGQFLGTAQEELRYTSPFDPATYSIGTGTVVINANANWTNEHVGELWWDLSTVKYVWYEQGELEYRKNNWNTVFPGSSIDVYEWVSSTYRPSEWAAIADTSDGLAQGISGQPKFSDNSTVSVAQKYNAQTGQFVNIYYFWVKNKTVVPSIKNRRISAFEVAQFIKNPLSSGQPYLGIIGPTAVMLANIKNSIVGDTINLKISFDTIPDAAPRHTEWAIITEDDPAGVNVNSLLTKLVDSLLGYDAQGKPVPDPTLPDKLKYGLEIRPRQSMFVNRIEAVRNLIEYTNSIVINLLLLGNISYDNLNAKDPLPTPDMYDQLVEDIYTRDLISTKSLRTAVLEANVDLNGLISSVTIVDPGYGYLVTPTISVVGDTSGASLQAIINGSGEVVGIDILNSGMNFTSAPYLYVRPYTVVVQTDNTIGGKWAVYEWDQTYQTWSRTQTQSYDTTQYWSYAHWSDSTFNPLVQVVSTVPSLYVLQVLQDIPTGSYVKVLDGGYGFFNILRKTDGTGGTFDPNWDLIFVENGTIKILDKIWNESLLTTYAFDEQVGFDQTEFDQGVVKEAYFIIKAIVKDIFNGPTNFYNTRLWFKAVKYALTEQKFLDWAFKTTFISVTNDAGSLDQRPTYKLQNSQYYEQFLNEIKPYHTKVRKFTEQYTSTEYSASFTSDFDLPAIYNTTTQNYNKIEFGNSLLAQYPWKSWYDNFTFGVQSIVVANGGANYTQVPNIEIISAPGDLGFGATAQAYITGGTISSIVVTNPGLGYSSTPTVVINGGGSTNLTTATAYAQLGQGTETGFIQSRDGAGNVRLMTMGLKFDRVASYDASGNVITEIGSTSTFTDSFVGDGEKDTFRLTWLPSPDKKEIVVYRNSVLQTIDQFNITLNESVYQPQPNTSYRKKYGYLVLNFIPVAGEVITVTYPKSLDLYTAVDRINYFYQPGSGMPGTDYDQLMSGMSYSGLNIDTLPFSYSAGFDSVPFGSTTWDNYASEVGYYSYSLTTTTSVPPFIIPDIIPSGSSPTQVNTYVQIGTAPAVRLDGPSNVVPTLIGRGTAAVDKVVLTNPGLGYVYSTTQVTISAPNSVNGTQAVASFTLNDDGSFASIGVSDYTRGSGYTSTPVVTITGNSTVQAYASAFLRAEFTTATNIANTFTSLTIPDAAFTASNTSTLVIFRYSTSDGTVLPSDTDTLDAVISGGLISDGQLSGALGTTPSEIVLDGGNGFLSTINSPAPEEHVPGSIHESVGITVFTQPAASSAVISTKRYWSDGITQTFALGAEPVNLDSVLVLLNDTKLTVNVDYTIDFSNNLLTLTSSTPAQGWLTLTVFVGGSIGLLDYYETVTTNATTVYLSSVRYTDVGSIYITIDGVAYQSYNLDSYRSRARVSISQPGTIQVYLFRGTTKSFSEVVEQVVNITTTTTSIGLTQPPGNVGPFHSQVIVTKNGLRLTPPITTYYQVANNQTTFQISQSVTLPSKRTDLKSLEVYVNGALIPTSDWVFDQPNKQIIFSDNYLNTGDVVAIVVKVGHDYIVQNGLVVLTKPARNLDVIRVTTFTNHDPDLIRSERYVGHATNTYVMQRPVFNSSYVWVAYNGKPLTVNVDYRVEADGQTVVINDKFYTGGSDAVVITSFANLSATHLVGYRIFDDIFGNASYKRISSQNSTFLTQDLTSTATNIFVQDGSVLSTPNIAFNRPGVILVNGERIEFFQISGNVLAQLRRGTYGTTPPAVHSSGTQVLDQGSEQTIPFQEFTQYYSTVTTTSTQTTFYIGENITFNTSTKIVTTSSGKVVTILNTNLADQVEVKYGGRRLLKAGLSTVVHDFDLSYDSTSTADTSVSPEFTVTTSSLTLNFTPDPGVKLEVTRRISQIWYNPNSTVTLAENLTPQAEFLIERPAQLPQGTAPFSNVASDLYIILETGQYLLDENGVPLQGA